MLVVDVMALRHVGAELDRARILIRSTLDDIETEARRLAGSWGGEAQRAYAGRRDAWRRAADDLTALLGELGRAVDDSVHDYLVAENRTRAFFD